MGISLSCRRGWMDEWLQAFLPSVFLPPKTKRVPGKRSACVAYLACYQLCLVAVQRIGRLRCAPRVCPFAFKASHMHGSEFPTKPRSTSDVLGPLAQQAVLLTHCTIEFVVACPGPGPGPSFYPSYVKLAETISAETISAAAHITYFRKKDIYLQVAFCCIVPCSAFC